jgi:hypothetical protein
MVENELEAETVVKTTGFELDEKLEFSGVKLGLVGVGIGMEMETFSVLGELNVAALVVVEIELPSEPRLVLVEAWLFGLRLILGMVAKILAISGDNAPN